MKYPFVFLFTAAITMCACRKSDSTAAEQQTPTPIVCKYETIKERAGTYEMRQYWDVYDSVTPHHVVYDTVFVDFHLDYEPCNQLVLREKGLRFPFDSVSKTSFINVSSDPTWTAGKLLSLTHPDSIFYREEYGHLGRAFTYYVGRKK